MVRILLSVALLMLVLAACGSGSPTPPADTAGDVADALADLAMPDVLDDDAEADAPEAGEELVEDLGPDVPEVQYPDPAFVHKFDAPASVSAADTYLMDEATMYRTPDQLPGLDVRALSMASGGPWAATAIGLMRYNHEEARFDEEWLGEDEAVPLNALASELSADGRLACASDGALYLHHPSAGTTEVLTLPGTSFTAVEGSGDFLYVGSATQGLFFVDLSDEAPALTAVYEEEFPVRDLVLDAGGNVWLATDAGVRRFDGTLTQLYAEAGGFVPDNDVRALAFHPPTNTVFAGTATGLSRMTGQAGAFILPGEFGLPTNHLTALAFAGETLAIGHEVGATSLLKPLDGDGEDTPYTRMDHYVSHRWLPDDAVTDVAIDEEDRVWVATPAGISIIQWVEKTFVERAAAHEAVLDEHFWRMDGFVASDVNTDDAWAPTAWSQYDKDNDGLWTQMQIGAWCYAYAATGDEAFYDKARKAMDVMMMQVDVPTGDFEAAGLGRGFVTRSLVRHDEGALFDGKEPQDNWHLVSWTDGHDYYWKDDTSSDEIDGHFFGYPIFYDLCAKTDEERAEIADYASAIADYIIEHGYVLLDLDGEKTLHGHWSPELIGQAAEGIDKCLEATEGITDLGERFALVEGCYESWSGGGWLNGTEIIGTLLATWHMTGDTKYYDEYEKLLLEHHYENLLVPHDETLTITSPSIMNHSDHELAMLAYHTLIRYEPNDDRRQKWIDGLLTFYEWEKVERNPLWAAFVALLAGADQADLEPSLQSLRELPDDRREWRVDNSHRLDSEDWPDDRHGDPQFVRVFPYDEIRTVWWNGNLHVKAHGGNGAEWSGPMAWLLPYYAFRYSGVISE